MTANVVMAAVALLTPAAPSPPHGAFSISSNTPSVAYSFVLGPTDQSQDAEVTLYPSATGPNGWHITVESSALSTPEGVVAPDMAMSVNGSSASPAAGTPITVSNYGPGPHRPPIPVPVPYPVTIPSTSGGQVVPATVYGAEAHTGIGSFQATVDLWLSVPANVLAGTYASTVTWSIVTGP